MQWNLTDEQETYQESLRGWLAQNLTSETLREYLKSGDSAPFDAQMLKDGWLGVGIDESVGGQGGNLVELAMAAEEFGRSGAPSSPWLASVLATVALAGRTGLAETMFGTGESIALAIPADRIPGDGPNLSSDAEGVITGDVPSVLGADRAVRFIVPVTTSSGRELHLVDATDVEVTRRRLLDGSRSVADLEFRGVVGERLDVDADEVLERVARIAAVLTAADSLGASQRMLDMAVSYSLQRKQFGVAIGSFQAVKHAAAMMLVATEAARSIVYFAAASVAQEHPEASLHASAVKAQVTAEGAHTADSALTLHGAIGYTEEHDLQIFYKRAKLNEYLFGQPHSWNERIARGLTLV